MSWAPEPTWFTIWGQHVSVGLFFVVASYVFCCLWLLRAELLAGRDGTLAWDWLVFAIAGGVAGARLGYFVFEIPAQFVMNPSGLLLQPGFSLVGGAWGLLLASSMFARLKKQAWLGVLEWLAVPLAVAFALTSLATMFDPSQAGHLSSSTMCLAFPLFDAELVQPPCRVPAPQIFALGGCLSLVIVSALAVRKSRYAAPLLLLATGACMLMGEALVAGRSLGSPPVARVLGEVALALLGLAAGFGGRHGGFSILPGSSEVSSAD